MKWFGFILAVMVATQQAQAVDPVTAATVVSTTIAGGAKLIDVMGKLKDKFLNPITAEVDAQIKKVNVDLDGLVHRDKKLITDARINLFNARLDITNTRVVLSILAEDTIKQSKGLKKVMKFILDGNEKQMIAVKILVKRMKRLMERSMDLLKEAKVQYDSVAKKLGKVKINLELFSEQVAKLGDKHDKRYKEFAARKEKEIKAGFACFVFPPSCLVVLPIINANLKKALAKYRSKVREMKRRASSSGAAARNLAKKTTADLEFLKKETVLIWKWESRVISVYADFKSGDYVTDIQEEGMFDPNYGTSKLDDLIQACQDYLKAVPAIAI